MKGSGDCTNCGSSCNGQSLCQDCSCDATPEEVEETECGLCSIGFGTFNEETRKFECDC